MKKKILDVKRVNSFTVVVIVWAVVISLVMIRLYIEQDDAGDVQDAPEYVVEMEPVETIVPEEPVVPDDVVEYSDEDLEILALIIYQEAGADACSDETRLMVGNVVLNRVADDRFPDSIKEVALQRAQYGRLYWTGLVWPERTTNPGEAHAVERAYDIARRLLEGERILPEDVIFQAEFTQGTEVVVHQDGFYFCR